eukprot:TRINITY_DN4562_c0_g3_i6.p2 TRINITY_DN4562_c0_g3~~TRINITY_DN4562_c0_g3_i6.p2  ORF type:complete len:213 (-),score=75.96 TRINITY_DN4562_c0_g3_i6:316-954(-)
MLFYYVFFTCVVTGVAASVDRHRSCSVPVFEWLGAHLVALGARMFVSYAVLRFVRPFGLAPRSRFVATLTKGLGAVSRATDAICLLVALVGLSYVLSTAEGDCPATSPFSYRALALLVFTETGGGLLAAVLGACAMAGGWSRGVRFCRRVWRRARCAACRCRQRRRSGRAARRHARRDQRTAAAALCALGDRQRRRRGGRCACARVQQQQQQ